jgi:serine/threonine-protein kinase HipA
MVDVAEVRLWDKTAGAVAWHPDGYAVFEYDPAFIKTGLDIAPITMPIQKSGGQRYSFDGLDRDTYYGLPGLLADSLPDSYGNALIDAWLVRQGRSIKDIIPIERLCYTGNRGMGALEFKPATRDLKDKSTTLDVAELVALAQQVLSQRSNLQVKLDKNEKDALLEIIRVGTSAGGARAKAVIAFNETTKEVRSGQIGNLADFDYWIIKFDGVSNKLLGDPEGYGLIEYAYYKMASSCGIVMMPSMLFHENGRNHFMTRRFDRPNNEKIHMQTLCAIAHYDYKNAGAYSYEQAFQVMRLLRLPHGDAEQLFRRMVFNVATRNQDDHTKNISFLMDKNGAWSLSPAYDVTYAYSPTGIWTKSHQMSINGKRDNITRDDLLTIAHQMHIKRPNDIIDEINNAAASWNTFASDAGVDKSQIKSIQKAFVVL